MMPDGKALLLALLDHAGKWSRNAEALDASGNGVVYDDDAAVAWDITGALRRLFGWQRAYSSASLTGTSTASGSCSAGQDATRRWRR